MKRNRFRLRYRPAAHLRPVPYAATIAETGLPQLFNPFRERDPDVDLARAPALRRANLRRYLAAQQRLGRGRDLWLAEAPGATGTRRTGIPLVDERELPLANAAFAIEPPLQRATRGGPVGKTTTGTAIWAEIARTGYRPVLWNVLPHHPFRENTPRLTNRAPRAGEVKRFTPLVAEVYETLCAGQGATPRVVAIGRFAERLSLALGLPCSYVRHPAQGGLRAFREGMAALYPQGG